MTQENKELLLKDLCGRLPYRVKVQCITKSVRIANASPLIETLNTVLYRYVEENNIEIKPYLRPMSSMTKEEKDELAHYDNCIQRTDFFYSHHIDCRFMIEKGLAIEVTEDNNPYL